MRRCLAAVHAEAEAASRMSDEELLAACRQMVDMPKFVDKEVLPTSLRVFLASDLGDADARALALAVEAFSRFPPRSLPRGSRLYEQQIATAAHLLRGTLVQMDTGEGKTFAIMAAALALLRVHPKVYIVTANSYLAARDAVNTAPTWEALGIPVAHTTDDSSQAAPWRARIVYTTLSELAFRSLHEDLGGTDQELRWAAVLLDEADAVLLEQASRPYQSVRATADPTKDWTEALRIAARLSPEDVSVERDLEPSVILTASGEAFVDSLAKGQRTRPADRLRLLRDVELCYLAMNVVREGHEYEVRGGLVLTRDPNTGWPTPSVRYAWVAPLEAHLGLPGQPRDIGLQFVDGISVLRRFDHLAGASGTIVGEAIEYLFLLGIVPTWVPPRRPRWDRGRLPDVVALSRELAYKRIEREVAVHGPRRPILIATESTMEVHELTERLRSSAEIAGVSIRPATDETIATGSVFESAGQPGVTIVSTRAAGRGVDIRLSPEAREAGGAALMALGHSLEARIDRQLLGRVGREGDPFTAQFFNHTRDTLMSRVNPNLMERILHATAVDGTVEGGMLRRTLAQAQRIQRLARLQRFSQGIATARAREKATEVLRGWRRALGVRTESGAVGDRFGLFLADRFIQTRFPSLSFGHHASLASLTAIAEEVVKLGGGDRDEANELAVKAAGADLPEARRVFTAYLATRIAKAQEGNRCARADLGRRLRRAEVGAVHARLADFGRGLRRVGGVDGYGDPSSLLRAALSVAPSVAAVPVSPVAVESALEELMGEDRIPDGEADLAHALARAADRRDTPTQGDAQAFDPRWDLWSHRSTWMVASETIDLAFQQLEAGLDRAEFRFRQAPGTARAASAQRKAVVDLQREVEATLARDCLANIFAGEDPSSLDELFAAAENTVDVHRPAPPVKLPSLLPAKSEPDTPRSPRRVPSSDVEPLVAEYAAAVRERMGEEVPDETTLVVALRSLFAGAEPAALADPDRVAEAYGRWKRSAQRRTSVPPWRWRSADRYVRGFLAFLNDRGMVAPLPTGISQRSQSVLRRAWRGLASPGIGSAIGALLLAALVAALFALAPPLSGGLSLGVSAELVDRFLTAGAFSSGSPLGPFLLGLLGGLWLRVMLGGPASGGVAVVPGERLVAMALLAGGALVASRPLGEGLSPHIPVALGASAIVFFGGVLMLSCVYWFERVSRAHVLPVLAAAFAVFGALPLLIREGDPSPVLAIAVFSGLVLAAGGALRRASVGAVAVRPDDGGSEPESMRVRIPVKARLSIAPHAMALLFAWAISCLILDGDATTHAVAAGLTYLAVLAFWTRALARSATDAETWRERMRRAQQSFDSSVAGGSLEHALARARQRVVAGEVAVAFALVAVATVLTLGAPERLLEQLPLGVATVFLSVVVFEYGAAFARGLFAPAIQTTDPSAELEAEYEGTAERLQGLVGYYTKRMGGFLAALVVLRELLDVLNQGEVAVRLFEWLTGLF